MKGRFQASVYHRKGLLTIEGLVLSFVTGIRCRMVSGHLSVQTALYYLDHMLIGHQGQITQLLHDKNMIKSIRI